VNHTVIKNNSIATKATLGSLLVGIYLFSVPAFSYAIDLELNFIPQWIGLIVVLYALIDFFRTGKPNIPFEIKLYSFFVLWLVFTYFLVGESNHHDALFTSIKVAIITVAITQLIKNDKDFYRVLFIYGLSIFAVAYQNYDTLSYLRIASSMSGINQFDGTLANSNTAAIYATSIIWLYFLLLLRPRAKMFYMPFYISAISIALFILYFTGSKKGMLGIILFGLFAAWLILRKYKYSLVRAFFAGLLGAGLIVLALYFVYTSPFFYRLESMVMLTDKGSTSDRIFLFNAAIKTWLDNGINFIFGIGHDNFRDFNTLRLYSHSTISEVLVSSGIIGFFLYFSALGVLLKKLYFLSKQHLYHHYFTSIFNCGIFITLILFFNATAVLYSERDLWPLIGIVASFSMYLSSTKQTLLMSSTEKQP